MKTQFLVHLKDVLEIEDRELFMEDKFREYPEWDSLAFLSLLAMLDEEYDIQIEEAEFKQLITVEDLFNAVNK